MLCELYQVVINLQQIGIPLPIRHQALDPMGKNETLLVVRLGSKGAPERVEVIEGASAGRLLRISHGFEGAAFPGFNLPTPLRALSDKEDEDRVDKLLASSERKRATTSDVAKAVGQLFAKSQPPPIKTEMEKKSRKRQANQFRLSAQELVGWLIDDFATAGGELENFQRLLQVVFDAKMELEPFTQELATILASPTGDHSSHDRLLFADWLFKDRKLPIFLDLADDKRHALPVSDPRTAELLNQHMLKIDPLPYTAETRREGRRSIHAVDAFTGISCDLPSTFDAPKLAVLGNVILFSNDAAAANCRFRYGQGNSATFKVSRGLVQQMAGGLLALAGEDREGKTCRSIPGNKTKRDERTGKMAVVRELLIAFPEDEPATNDPYADLFASHQETFREPDFVARAQPVLKALDGKLAANTNQPIRLLTIAPVDQANKQIGLNRTFSVREVADAARAWQSGASNCPEVTLPFFDKQNKHRVGIGRAVPSPLEVALVANQVWSADADTGLRESFERALTTGDAYDVFLGSGIVRQRKTRRLLQLLLARMIPVFRNVGRVKATGDFDTLYEKARWHAIKAVALIGISLKHLGHRHESFMKEPTYQVGRMLAVADSLHFHYCKWVRTPERKRQQGKVDAPGELLGNAIFAAALDDPKRALARLAERIKTYQGWAKTYSGEEDWKGRWLLRLWAECVQQLDLSTLPARMQDIHKAQLLLGYLADHPKSESKSD